MRTTTLLVVLYWLLAPLHAAENPPRDLGRLEALQAGFPRTLLFRFNALEQWADDHRLESHLAPFNGDTRKYADEETDLRPRWQAIMTDFKRRRPQELALIHLNGEARTTARRAYLERYFPGHWTYLPGEVLPRDLATGDTVIPVADHRLFSRKVMMRLRNGTGEMLPSIILVRVDERGNRVWEDSEYAQITAVDPQRSTLTVKRGEYFSTARAFRGGRTYVAPMHCEHWGGHLMWTLNLSAACPRDPRGDTAADISLREIREWCGPGGVAGHVDGIGFDVMYFGAKFPGWDLDNDGKVDNGVAPDGRNFQLEGVYGFTKRLRAQMGDEFLLTSDGWEPNKQRAVGTFNGIESEGLCAPNDGWRKFAQTLNAHTYWNLHNNVRHPYSYITAKLMHPADMAIASQLHRMGLATACALGVSYTNADSVARKDGRPMIPEMHRGAAEEPNWLGRPVGPMVLLPVSAPDLFAGGGKPFTPGFSRELKTDGCRISVESEGSLLIKGTAANPYQPMKVTLPGVSLRDGDLAVFFEALAVDPLTGLDRSDRLPRLVSVSAQGLPEYTDQIGRRSFYNDFMGYMGTPGYTPITAYFRRAGQGSGTVTLTLTFEHQGACRIRNLTTHNAPMALTREFEQGVVLVNASEAPVIFDLRQHLPGLQATGLWRLRANAASYADTPGARAMLSYNDGRRENPARIEVPERNGLFLAKAPQ